MKNNHYQNFGYGLMVNTAIFAAIIYCCTVLRFAFNQPVGDDYDAILAFLNQYMVAQPAEQFQLFVRQHNEHRIFFTRLVTVLDLKIFDHINFVHLIWIGNLGWFISILGFWSFAKQYRVTIPEFTPVVIALLSFSHFDMMTWAMTSIQQYWQVCFGIFAIGFMVNNRFKLSLLFYTAAVFTSGGGIILAPVLNLYYLIQKQWRHLTICILLTIVILSIYFLLLPYTPPPPGRISEALMQPQLVLGYLIGFLGSLSNNLDLGISTILLCGSVLSILFLMRIKFIYKSAPFLWWTTLYIILTGILTALNRSATGIISSGDSRYSEYSLLFGVSVYLSYLLSSTGTHSRKKIMWIGFTISLILFSYWYEQSKRPFIDRLHWLSDGIQTHPNWPAAQDIKKRSIELGIMKPD